MERAVSILVTISLIVGVFSSFGGGDPEPRRVEPPRKSDPISRARRTVEDIIEILLFLDVYDKFTGIDGDKGSATIQTGNVYITYNIFYPLEFVESHGLHTSRDLEQFDREAQRVITMCTDRVLAQGNMPAVYMYQHRSKCLMEAGYSVSVRAVHESKQPVEEVG
jgi:hypothetical protein